MCAKLIVENDNYFLEIRYFNKTNEILHWINIIVQDLNRVQIFIRNLIAISPLQQLLVAMKNLHRLRRGGQQ